MNYRPRLIDKSLKKALSAAGAVQLKGPKSCGKTETAKQLAKSTVQVDKDSNVGILLESDPEQLLKGATPRLFDEWQVHPKLWNYIRHAVDERHKKGQFILTGSANPSLDVNIHSGAGRFIVLNMRTLSWQELGFSTAKIKLKELLSEHSQKISESNESTTLNDILTRLVIGGWPELLQASLYDAILINRSYIDLIASVDISRVSEKERDPITVRRLLESVARNTATNAEISTLAKDISQDSEAQIASRPTVTDYLQALQQLMIIEDQPAWRTHIRSSIALRKTPKRHLSDPSLAVAALGLDVDSLRNDLRYTGLLFESLAVHNLRVYADAEDAQVFYYGNLKGDEVDAIVQRRDGNVCAFEIKLGADEKTINAAATALHKMARNVNQEDSHIQINSLNVLVGVGDYAYTRQDGINVIPLSLLGV